MAAAVNKMSDEWLQERSQAPLDKMKDWVVTMGTPLVNAVQDRMGVAQAGKRMLDEGGEQAELTMLAKKIALDAVALDKDIVAKLHEVVDLYKEAACLIHNQASLGLDVLLPFSAAYAERSQMYSRIVESVGELPHEPPMTDVEWDAIKFIRLRQAKAHLGLGDSVGGTKGGKHGRSFFTCVDKDQRPQASIADSNHMRDSAGFGYVPDGLSQASAPQNAAYSFDEASGNPGFDWGPVVEAVAQDTQYTPSVGGSLASRVETMTRSTDPQLVVQSLQPPPSPPLSQQEECEEVTDAANISVASLAAPSSTPTLMADTCQVEKPTLPLLSRNSSLTSTASNARSATSSTANTFASKDAERQAASRRLLQETRRGTPPRVLPESDVAAAPSTLPEAVAPQGPYPGLTRSNDTTTSYAVHAMAPAMVPLPHRGSESVPVAVEGCSYTIGDPVEVFSQSANEWVAGAIVKVEGSVLTVRYGDRERQVDLRSQNVARYFRRVEQYAVTSKPAFDSMVTHAGGVEPGPSEFMSVEPRVTKAAVL